MLTLLNRISLKILCLIFLVYCSEINCFSQSPVLIQAEAANSINTGTIENSDQGYTGAGYVNLDNRAGTYVEWVINIPTSDYNTVTVRYANGSTDRTMNIIVNGNIVKQNLNFVSTGDWTIWHTISFQVNLSQGLNNLRFEGSNPDSGPSLDYIILSKSESNAIDWSVEMANMIINTHSPDLPWDYTEGLLLEGVLRVYKRTNDVRYLNFIKEWAENHIAADGTISEQINSLDFIMPGFLILHLYHETGIERFKLAADKLRTRFDTYPRTPDGGFWHMTHLEGELWLDGLYMGMPFLATYGQMFDDENYAYTEAIQQFKLHIDYLLNNETGLLLHAFDYDGSASWALPPYKRSPYAWGRAVGWVMMGLSEILDIIPENFPGRNAIVEQYKTVLKALATYQDPVTGLWYQVIDHQDDPGNWLETSCSMMFVYSMSRAIQKGFLDDSYKTNVDSGYSGIMSKISEDEDMVYLTDICEGTSVSSDIQYYFGRARNTNDNHGLGTFLIMNELVRYNNFPWLITDRTLSVAPSAIIVSAQSGVSDNFNVTSTTSWSVTDDAAWLNLSAASGTGNETITVTTSSANASTNQRSANVTFSASGVSSVIVTVTQSGLILTIPHLSTTQVSEITSTTARSGGSIISDGGTTVIVRGVCWSTNENPTIALNTKTTDGTGIGSFISNINGLTPGTTYYLRAYATNSFGTAYGEQVTFKSDLNTGFSETENSEIIIFPNPVKELLTIKYHNDEFKSIKILNSQGVIIAKEKVIAPVQLLDFTQYEPGLYIIEFVKNGDKNERVKIIKL